MPSLSTAFCAAAALCATAAAAEVGYLEEIEHAIGPWERRALCDALMRAGVPAAPVHSVSEAFAQPHAAHRRMRVARERYGGIGLPVRLHATPGAPAFDPRPFNADAVRVLQDVGYGPADIDRLVARGGVLAPVPGAGRRP